MYIRRSSSAGAVYIRAAAGIDQALIWCGVQVMMIDPQLVENLPGSFSDRKTPLGELNWIFTAVTDTIAWNVLEFKVRTPTPRASLYSLVYLCIIVQLSENAPSLCLSYSL